MLAPYIHRLIGLVYFFFGNQQHSYFCVALTLHVVWGGSNNNFRGQANNNGFLDRYRISDFKKCYEPTFVTSIRKQVLDSSNIIGSNNFFPIIELLGLISSNLIYLM